MFRRLLAYSAQLIFRHLRVMGLATLLLPWTAAPRLAAQGTGEIPGQGPGEANAPQQAAKPNVEPLGGGKFRIGTVEFDSRKREIRIPAVVNMRGAEGEAPLEYLLVRTHGKVHESLFTTDTPALDINLAFALLSYPPSAEFYAIPNDTGGLSGEFPEVPEAIRRAARVRIDVELTKDGNTSRFPVGEWIRHTTKLTPKPLTAWVYGGSEFFEGTYVPESTGDLVAIFTARAAMINFSGDERKEDTSWQVYPGRVPDLQTPVILIVSPFHPSEIPKPSVNPPQPRKSTKSS